MAVPAVARANPSTAQTNAALVSAATNRGVQVSKIYVSSDTEMTVTIVNSETHDILWRQYVGARGGAVVPTLFWSAWNEGLDYTTSVDGNVFLLVEYHRIGRGNS
jgi:hypothetical protein